MKARLAERAAAALVDAMHRAACRPAAVYLDVPAFWREPGRARDEADAAARELGPFAMRQAVGRFALRFVAGLAQPELAVDWQGRAASSRISIP
jgi:hypothetical protein